jgi:anaerobic magnesium-protoporphyrin IX monomethyl ester cyclase
MKIALLNPPEMTGFVSDKDKAGGIGVAKPHQNRWRTPYMPPTPPMDWLYAGALLERGGIDFEMVDSIGDRLNQEKTIQALKKANPTHIGIRFSMPSLDDDLALTNELKSLFPTAQIFIYGHAIQTTYSKWKARCHADTVFFGEVEALLLPYLNGEASPHLLSPSEGNSGACGWAYVDDLDNLPFPAWHLIDINNYVKDNKQSDFVYYILTSRGCPKGCSMCPYYVHQGKQWRFRSVDNVLKEFAYLRGLNAQFIQTRDPNISWRKNHLIAIAEGLQGETQFKISTETDLEVLNDNDLKLLKSAGFVRIMTGVESVDESIIKEIGQNGNALKRVLDNMVRCQELEIDVTGFFIVGSLQETWQSVRNTVATAKALPINYSVSLMTPYFGTAMREEFLKSGFYTEADSFKRYNGYSGLIRTSGLDFQDVILAHAWASAELELVVRERQAAKLKGAEGMKAQLRVYKQQLLVNQLREEANLREAAGLKQEQAEVA